MNVLILCETSGQLRRRFYDQGHTVVSVDVLPHDEPTSHPISGTHIQADAMEFLRNTTYKWDLIIMHPPCTAMALSGNAHYGKDMPKHAKRLEAIEWTKELWDLACEKCERVALENPASVIFNHLDKDCVQYIQPYQFGHKEQKRTGFALKGLPKLQETDNVKEEMMKLPRKERERIHFMSPSKDRWKERSKTFDGIADAIANQWGSR